MPMADAMWTQGDTAPALETTLTYTDDSTVDLSGATVQFVMRSLTDAQSVPIKGTIEIADIHGGVVRYLPDAADTSTPGNFMFLWVVTFPDGVKMSFPTEGYSWALIKPSLTAEPQQLVSLPDVKEWIGMSQSQHDRDHELLTIIEGVRPMIEMITGPILPTIYDEWHQGGSTIIQLRHRPSFGYGSDPLLDLIAVSEYRGPNEFPLAIIPSPSFGSIYSVMLDPAMGVITRRSAGGSEIPFMPWPGDSAVHVIYRAGQKTVPPNVRLAVLDTVRFNFRSPQPAGRGLASEADAEDATMHLPVVLPVRAREQLTPLRRGPAFA